jgi:outer membrane protein OmpA-like peptidoglycan-associated protein
MPRHVALATLAATLLSLGAAASSADANRRVFVGCPLIRDTAEVPCWLASDGTTLYYLGLQVDISAPFHPPQLKHKVLVEGVIADEPAICGGVVLKPVTISVLPELDGACDTILPAEGYRIDDPPRGAGPSNRGKRVASDPAPPPATAATSSAPAPAPASSAPAASAPLLRKTFRVPFAFDSLYMDVHAFPTVLAAARYASGAPGAHIEVIGYRGSVRLTDGRLLVEYARISRDRAEKVGRALEQLNIAGSATSIRWRTRPEPPAESPGSRRVEITVMP